VAPYVFGNEHVRYWRTVARGREPELDKPRVNSLARTWWGHLGADAFYRLVDLLTMVSTASSKDALLSSQGQLVVAFASHIEACVVSLCRQAVPRKRPSAPQLIICPTSSILRNVVRGQLLKYVLSDNEAFARVMMGFYVSATDKVSLHGCRSPTLSGLCGTTEVVLFSRVLYL
jgi:hypothetical protein